MYRLLSEPKLMEKIVEELRTPLKGPTFREDYHAFYALIHTCKALSDVSLNALWRKMDSLLPLMELIPTVAWLGDQKRDSVRMPTR